MPKNYNFRNAEHYPFGINQYVPALQGLADHAWEYNYLFDFQQPQAAAANNILNAAAVGKTFTIGGTDALTPTGDVDSAGVIGARWGREVVIFASGAGTNNVTINGYDYLGQKVTKTKALNGATPVPFGVAIKRVESIVIASGGAITVSVGTTNALGVPYRINTIEREMSDGVGQTTGTVVAGTLTDPATAGTGDPRGLYTPTTTPDGIKQIIAIAVLNPWVNDNGNGGLHGIKQYAA